MFSRVEHEKRFIPSGPGLLQRLARMVTITVVPTKSDSDVILCLQLLSLTLMCTLHSRIRESIYHMCINRILWIGLIHKRSIDSKSLITL